jgi:predicted RNA binding protein YcfA (HicA-like mRNA interferase family)
MRRATTQLEKLAARLAYESTGSALADLERLLSAHGWQRTQGKGSHLVFKEPGPRPITIATLRGRRVKCVYVVDVLRRLGVQE